MAPHSKLPLPAYRPFISGTVGFIIPSKADKYLLVFEARVQATAAELGRCMDIHIHVCMDLQTRVYVGPWVGVWTKWGQAGGYCLKLGPAVNCDVIHCGRGKWVKAGS